MTQEQFEKKLQLKFINENYRVLYYGKNSADKTELKCLDCSRHIIVNTGELFRSRRKHICSKCHYKRKDTIKNEQQIIQLLEQRNINDYHFYMRKQNNNIRVHCVHIKCQKCGKVSDYRVVDLLRDAKHLCQYCESAKRKKDNDIYKQELALVSDNFEILNGYTGANNNIKVRCKICGFIREVKPTTFLKHQYCPKCGKIKSKGEQRIINILNNQHIDFIHQKYFKEWNEKLHYFDFYIPKYNLIIEYMGKQHYQYTEFFHKTSNNFQIQQQKDLWKKQIALKHNINYCSISYINYNNLELILNTLFDSTTISQESRPKWVEIETIFDKDKDIVWTYTKV